MRQTHTVCPPINPETHLADGAAMPPPEPPPPLDRTLIEALRSHLRATSRQPVVLIETHISWVLLAGSLAYKIKKPVRLPFVDFSTLASRRRFCDIELQLNQRLAPQIYREVVPVCGSPEAPRLGGGGAPRSSSSLRRVWPTFTRTRRALMRRRPSAPRRPSSRPRVR